MLDAFRLQINQIFHATKVYVFYVSKLIERPQNRT